MGLAFYKKLLLHYQNASLPLKISVPFILMFLGFWVGSTTAVGLVFSNQLEQKQQERATELINQIDREIGQELSMLQKKAHVLSLENSVIQGTVRKNHSQLQQKILPLFNILNTQLITVVGQEKQPLFHLETIQGQNSGGLQDQTIQERLLSGSGISTVASDRQSGAPVLVGAAPIKHKAEVVGGLILGNAIDNQFVTQLNQSINEQIVILGDHGIVASTFPPDFDAKLFEVLGKEHLRSFVRIHRQDFLAQSIVLEDIGGQRLKVVLLVCQQPLTRSLNALWIWTIVPMGLIGALVTIVLGYWIAKRIARPVQDITLIAQQVVGEGRFDLRAPVTTQDDISILALSVNQLIDWVGQYTSELEVATRTLDTRVKTRTKKLSNTLKELQETQAQLIQTEKMSSLGQMIAGIAHEINNPISFVQGNIEPLKDYFQDLIDLIKTYQAEYPELSDKILQKQDEIDLDFLLKDLDKLLGSMNLGAERVHDIVKSLRNFSRLDEATVKDVDIHEGIDSTLLILNHRIKHEITVIREYGDLPLVRCFPAQLNQVFTNIIVNALDAILDDDSPGSSNRKKLKIVTRMAGSKQVQVVICDNGPGIPREVREKIFDPFFTTKPVGKGTGLGLGICFKIIQHHQGTIRIKSKVGKGTEVFITLPIDVLPAEPVMAAINAKGTLLNSII